MARARQRLVALAALVIALSVAAVVPAHLRFPTVKAERWIELRLGEEPIRIGYRIGFGARLAGEQRRAADRDGDFEVSASEGNAALDARTKDLLRALTVCTGRSLREVVCRKLELREVERVEAEGWKPGPNEHLHFAWTLKLRDRARDVGAIRVEDAYEVEGVEVSDVAIDPPAHTSLELAGEGGRAKGVASRFSWLEARRPPGPRVVVAQWAAPPRSSRAGLGVALGVAAALVLGWLGLSRRRRSAT